MGFNAKNHPVNIRTATIGSIATNGSSNVPLTWTPTRSGQIIGVRFVNGTTASVASGTTAASALNGYLYKTTPNSGSIVASARFGVVATKATALMTLATSTALSRFTGGEYYELEIDGGAGNNASNAGAYVEIDIIYGHQQDDATTST